MYKGAFVKSIEKMAAPKGETWAIYTGFHTNVSPLNILFKLKTSLNLK